MIYVLAIAAYLLFLIGVSYKKSRNVETQDDFMVAGRGTSAAVLVGTLVATWMGSGSLFAGAGRGFRQGFSALWMSAGAWVGLLIVYYLAPKVRRIAQYTVPDILETRYNATARVLGTIAIIIAYLTIASYQFIGGGRMLEILIGLDPVWGQAIICALVVVYLTLAGMSSIVALDIFNGTMIALGVIIALPIALRGAGGWSQLTVTLPEAHFSVIGALGLASALGLFFPTFFLLLGESSIYQKFMSAKDETAARRAVVGMIIGVVILETALVALAVFGAGIFWDDPAYRLADGSFNHAATETIVLDLAANALPTYAGVLLLLGAAAIIFSTANTFLIVPSTNLTRDIYQRFVNPEASEKTIIWFQRVTIVVMAVIAYIVTSQFTSILQMALYAYTMVGAAVTPALLAAFLWKRATPAGGAASVGAGISVTLLFAILARTGMESLNLGRFQLPLDPDYIIYPAATASFVALIAVSLLTPPPSEDKWRPFWPED